MTTVRAQEGVADVELRRVARMLKYDVLPVLRRVVGPGLITPQEVVLFADLDVEGRVPAMPDSQGHITSVSAPILRVSTDDVVLRGVLLHELAHHHELSVRQLLRVRVMNQRASELWSEYFAERTSWRCDARHTASVTTLSQSAPVDHARQRPIGISDYALVWLLAQDESRKHGAPELPERLANLLAFCLGACGGRPPLARMFAGFPRWSDADAARMEISLGEMEVRLRAADGLLQTLLDKESAKRGR